MVGHVNGHEEDITQENLIWICRSCNASTLTGCTGLASDAERANTTREAKEPRPSDSGWLVLVDAAAKAIR